MCKFKKNTGQDFRTVVAALRRYILGAPEIISGRLGSAGEVVRKRRHQEVAEMLRHESLSTGGTLLENSGSNGLLTVMNSDGSCVRPELSYQELQSG